ncbi:MAG: Vi polysaccharide biosynthesis UDP-N-acetylglucosamine C-6 dehydrogenase TviB [Gammaproteobacteria bacterium]|nr:Vi polysaccharide biosynthesis UDP-N-acetylglucosamine C-6 dehydrogenase TviB [Gammaproteobacteria bacterium]
MSVRATEALHIAVVGLGYVGLPLAVAFGRQRPVIGFDINRERIAALRQGRDATLELTAEELAAATQLRFSDELSAIADCNLYIIAVPTPIDSHKRPDLSPLRAASQLVAGVLRAGDIVVYESTVYPGATEEICVPLLAEHSGLVFNRDFFVGYSPERINPGDKQHRLNTIVKVTSGSTPEVAQRVDALYAGIIDAGTHLAPSIKVAEAAKVIENTQRDVNIALMNELAQIFARLGIDTQAVLAAAGSKWNFLKFTPGLVGGHCIGVDPYYLTHKAQEVGYQPSLIPASRLINEGMGTYVASRLIKLMAARGHPIVGARVLVLGLSFKENCPDLRNTRVVDIVAELRQYHATVELYDPWVDAAEAEREYGIALQSELREGAYEAVLIAVAHQQFLEMGSAALRRLGKPGAVLFDVKYLFPAEESDGRL